MYKISEFCRLVGLPKSRIRFYEKHGLLKDRQAANGYHYYTHQDAFRVNAFLALLQYGFSVERAVEMLDEEQSSDEFAASLESQKVEAKRRIAMLEHRIRRIDDNVDFIRNGGGPAFAERTMDAFLYVRASVETDFSPATARAATIEKFYAAMAAARCARIVPKDQLHGTGEKVSPSYIIGIPERDAHLLGGFDARYVERLDLGRCVIYNRTATRAESIVRSSFAPLFDYLEERKLELRADALILPAFLNLDGKGADREEIFVPVSPARAFN